MLASAACLLLLCGCCACCCAAVVMRCSHLQLRLNASASRASTWRSKSSS